METGVSDPGGGNVDELARRLETLERKLQESEKANSGAKTTARLITIVVAIVAVGGVMYLLYPIINAYNNSEEYYAAMYAEFEENVQPAVTRELQLSLETVGPEVAELARQALEQRQDDIVATAEREMRILIDTLSEIGEEDLAEYVVVVETGIRERFESLFPDLAQDPEQLELVLGNMDLAMEGAVAEVVNTRLSPHLESLANIETRLRQFPIPPRIRSMSDLQLGDEFNRALAEYVIFIIRDMFLQGTEAIQQPVVVAEGRT